MDISWNCTFYNNYKYLGKRKEETQFLALLTALMPFQGSQSLAEKQLLLELLLLPKQWFYTKLVTTDTAGTKIWCP